MTERIVDSDIRLIPYYRNDAVSLPWYQDPQVCKQVDDRDTPYDLELLHAMYDYLSSHGGCWYIEYRGVLVGMSPCATAASSPSSSAGRIRTGTSAAAASWICWRLQGRRAWSRSRRISIPSTGRASA